MDFLKVNWVMTSSCSGCEKDMSQPCAWCQVAICCCYDLCETCEFKYACETRGWSSDEWRKHHKCDVQKCESCSKIQDSISFESNPTPHVG
jgi:hypothetical protein